MIDLPLSKRIWEVLRALATSPSVTTSLEVTDGAAAIRKRQLEIFISEHELAISLAMVFTAQHWQNSNLTEDHSFIPLFVKEELNVRLEFFEAHPWAFAVELCKQHEWVAFGKLPNGEDGIKLTEKGLELQCALDGLERIEKSLA